MPSEIGAPLVGAEGSEGVEDIEEATHKDAAHKEGCGSSRRTSMHRGLWQFIWELAENMGMTLHWGMWQLITITLSQKGVAMFP